MHTIPLTLSGNCARVDVRADHIIGVTRMDEQKLTLVATAGMVYAVEETPERIRELMGAS